MKTCCHLIIFFLTAIALIPRPFAADPPEAELGYQAALMLFQDKAYDRAEREFAEFASKYPNSPRLREAILLHAQSLFEQRKFEAAAELLRSRLDASGDLRDRFLYWLAESEFYRQNFSSSAETYAELLKSHPDSALRLEASYGQAMAHFRAREHARVVELLKDPAGGFRQAVSSRPNDLLAARGFLLLAEAYFAQKEYRAVDEALNEMSQRELAADLDWDRQFLSATSAWADRRPEDALKRVAEALAIAGKLPAARAQVSRANALRLQAEIFRENQPESALKVYEQILEIANISTSQYRQATLGAVDLLAAQQQYAQAIQRLQSFLAQNPQDSALDTLSLTLGELSLKRLHQLPGEGQLRGSPAYFNAGTNLLRQARTQFDLIINSLTNSPLLGKAWLNRGWCCWEEFLMTGSAALLQEGQEAFSAAVERLPKSLDQAVAQLKLGDCQMRRQEHAQAISSYELLLERYADLPEAREKLFDQALFHIVNANVSGDNFEKASQALNRLLESFPDSAFADQSLLLLGQALLNSGQAAPARQRLQELETRYPNSALIPEARLAIARSHVEELDWTHAIGQLEGWTSTFTNHLLLPQAEFDRAWVFNRAGQATNALILFTNYVARFTNSPLAPQAQWWVAHHYLAQSNYVSAEFSFLDPILLQSTNHPDRTLSYRSLLNAAKAAYFREAPANAKGYLDRIVNAGTNCPPSILAEAYFVLGDVLLKEVDAEKPMSRYENAIVAFGRIPSYFPTNRLEPLANGRIADCHLQIASLPGGEQAQRYQQATNFYHKVIQSPIADISTRSQAEYGLAKVLERQAELNGEMPKAAREQLLKSALTHYQNIIYGMVLKPERNERPDLFWVREAGLAAVDLARRLDMLPVAQSMCDRLLTDLPKPQPELENRLTLLRSRQTE